MSRAVLIDTSVWVAHFRERSEHLVGLLVSDAALAHPFIWGELACGTPPDRTRTLGDIRLLGQAQHASLGEVLAFVEKEQLYGLGCGLIDLTLLVSVMLTPGAALWSLDKRLAALAERYGVMHHPSKH
ncbi:VapC toxin family PIN domain ribonuclease [Paucibacter sp. PLA-PC-4]|uniref:VapC toxin family PIN domain ribonuclease n=1 Tax=Paucibacter sp. PLA-PC-4 TaxID=2993655 RepID=UPI0022495222|nr:VapC toxin family PIN domain ribonuclease [Paucibacter sp. PLA-PC-4]MCX2861242.1 VapC toxin family PIN domain ribonuclease [Paucibacter sp. PLA-PC-4]